MPSLSVSFLSELVLLIIAESIGSLSSSLEASDAKIRTSSCLYPLNVITSARVNSFFVIVPVLSEHKISMPAISSMATSLLTIAFFFASNEAPTAIVTDKTAGNATGMAAIVNTSANCRVSTKLSCLNIETIKINAIIKAASTIK